MVEKAKEIKIGTFTAKFHECMPDGKLHLHAMIRYLQEMATGHADDLGCGYYDLKEINCYWVLSNIKVRISDLPRYNSEFRIQTWPSGLTKLLAEREFIVSNPKGETLLLASSQWLIMSADNNRPVNLMELKLNLPEKDEKVFKTKLNRLKARTPPTTSSKVTVPYSSLDVNGHVNNTEYIRWAVDAVCRQNGRFPDVKRLQFTYLSEVYLSDELEILLGKTDEQNSSLDIMGKNITTGKPAFLSKLTIQSAA